MDPIVFSQAARKALIRNFADKTGTVRLGVKGGACNGLQYVFVFDEQGPKAEDITWSVDGITVSVDKKSVLYLSGTVIDWTNGLMSQGFIFNNPIETSRCGCGRSFTVKNS